MHPPPPTSIKVLGILSLVFAGLGFFGLAASYFLYFGGTRLGDMNPLVEIARQHPGYMTYLKVTMLLSIPALMVYAASGIGLITMKPWARKLTIGYSIYAIVSSIAGLVLTYSILLAPLMASNRPGATGGVIGGLWGGIAGAAFPIVLLVFMLRRDVADAFARAGEGRRVVTGPRS